MSDEMTVAAFVVLACLWMVLALAVGLASLSNAGVPAVKSETRCCRVLAAAQTLGARIMSVVEEALSRLSAFVSGVLSQVKAAKDTNDAQTVKLAELQVALDAAVADDNADKATIAALQSEVSTLQESVAAQINAAVDALENPPVAEVVPVEESAPVVEEKVTEEVTVVEDAEVSPVEDAAVVVEEAVVVDPVELTADDSAE